MPRRSGMLLVALVAVAALAPVLAAGRAIADDWMPIGDNAALALDAHDVISTDTPLLGARTTLGGPEYDGRVRHLGPLESWALALPERLAQSEPWGIVVGVALVGIAALIAIAWAAVRVGGVGMVAWALALTIVACWSLGRQQLADPWNPYVAVLPLVAVLFLAWSAGAGVARALPPLALAASFVAQAHLLYVPIVGVLFAGAVVAVVVTRPAVRELVATAVVLAIAWALPVWDQLTHRPGNVVELSRAFRDDDQVAVSWTYALRAVGRAVGLVPLWARPARDVEAFGAELSFVTLFTAVVVVVGLIAGTVLAIRRRDRIAMSAGSVALVALGLVLATTAQVPVDFPDVAFYRMLTLWPVGVFTWFALGLMVVRLVPVPAFARRIGPVAAAVVLVATVPAVAFADSAHPDDERHRDAVRTLARSLEPALDDVGPVRVRVDGELFGEILYGMVRELRRRGVDARVELGDPYLDGSYVAPDDSITLYVAGPDAPTPAANARLLAEYRSTTDADLERLAELEGEVRALLAAEDIDALDDVDLYDAYRDGSFLRLVVDGDLDLSDDDRALLAQHQELRSEVEQLTLTAYLERPG